MHELSAEATVITFRDADGRIFNVLDSVDFAPKPGRLTAIVGASGSGKSTLLNVLSGLIRPDAGRVTFDGTDVSKLGEARRDRWRRDHIGLVFQNFHLIEELSPRDNVMVAAWFDRLSAAKLREPRRLAARRARRSRTSGRISTGCRAASSSGSRSPAA